MQISDVLTLERTCYHASVSSKKKALELIADIIANDFTNIQNHEVFDALVEREKLGTTAMTNGIAIPHARLSTTQEIITALILLKEPIDFDGPDKQGVDILFVIIVPPEENELYLEILSYVAERLGDPDYRSRLRQATSRQDLYERALQS